MKAALSMANLFCMSIMVISLFCVNYANAAINPDSVVGLWFFEEGSGGTIKDSSGNGHDGTVIGDVSWVSGEFGQALKFESNGTVEVPDHESLNFGTDSFTVVLWFSCFEPGNWNRLARERTPNPWGSDDYGWEIQTQQLLADWILIHWSLDDRLGNHQRTTYAGIEDGRWYHTAMIVDRETQVMITYLDGDNKQIANIGHIGSVTGDLPIVFGGLYTGSMDEVGIFRGILELEDIANIMENGLSEALSAEAAIDTLISIISEMEMQHGIKNSLIVKLESAKAAVIREQTRVAVNNLNAFINEVGALRDKKLTNQQADDLISSAERIIAILMNYHAAPPRHDRIDSKGKLPTIWGKIKAK